MPHSALILCSKDRAGLLKRPSLAEPYLLMHLTRLNVNTTIVRTGVLSKVSLHMKVQCHKFSPLFRNTHFLITNPADASETYLLGAWNAIREHTHIE
jgi:hypothetical protein